MTSKAVKQGAEALDGKSLRWWFEVEEAAESVLSTEVMQELIAAGKALRRVHGYFQRWDVALAAFQDEADGSHTDARGEN